MTIKERILEMFVLIPGDKKKEYREKLMESNRNRLRMASYIMFFSGLVFAYNLKRYPVKSNKEYMLLYGTFCGIGVIYLLVSYLFKKNKIITKFNEVFIIFLSALWASIVNLFHEATYGADISVFVIIIVVIAVTYTGPVLVAFSYIVSYIIFSTALPMFQENSMLVINQLEGLKPMIIFTYTLQIILYKNSMRLFMNEEKLVEESRHLRLIIDMIPNYIFAKDLDGKFILANKAMADVFHLSPKEVIGKTDLDYGASKEQVENYRKDDKRVIDSGELLFIKEEEIMRKDGSAGCFQTIKIPYKYSKHNKPAVLGVAMEITELKDMSKKINKEKEKAIEASKAKSEFLANMSHEIRTPLNGIIGFIDLMSFTKLDRVQRQYAENIKTSSHSLLGVINDILDFSKIESGKLELDPVMTNIMTIVHEASDVINYQASNNNVEFLLNIAGDVPNFAKVDPVRLKQVLINFLSNAVKFTLNGEIEFILSFKPKSENTGIFYFSVRDTGIGISQENQKKLFKAFGQADRSTSRKFGGTGLGLIISKNLIEKMGSEIEIESKENEGSKFSFALETEYQFIEEIGEEEFKYLKKVLIIDGNIKTRKILSDLFEYRGVETIHSQDAFEALEFLRKTEGIDLIILDYKVPKESGTEILKEIRNELKNNKESKLIILLHGAAQNIEIEFEENELSLIKPLKKSELSEALKMFRETKISGKNMIKQNFFGYEPITLEKIKVAVIEDVKLNIELIRCMIEQFMPEAEIFEAGNGYEAIELVKEKRPDIIFMDIQMPKLDGINATREIRLLEENTDSVPIIALTAGVIKEDEEKAMEAGMSGFLTKPIDQREIYKILMEYFKKEDEKEEEEVEDVQYKFEDCKELDSNEIYICRNIYGLDLKDGLGRTLNNRSLYLRLLSDFKKRSRILFEDIKKEAINKNYLKIKELSHNLRGIAGNVSAIFIYKKAEDIEKYMPEKSNEDIMLFIDELENDIEGFDKAYDIALSKLAVVEEEKKFKKVDEATLKKLKEQMLDYNPQALELIGDIVADGSGGSEILSKVKEKLEIYDFEEAAEYFDKYMDILNKENVG